jgi:predicted transcriptional regulator
MQIVKGKPKKPVLFVRLEPHLYNRMIHQCDRLTMEISAVTRQALVKFLEEEEAIEKNLKEVHNEL